LRGFDTSKLLRHDDSRFRKYSRNRNLLRDDDLFDLFVSRLRERNGQQDSDLRR
jgi:hypothetical protein